MADGDEAFGYGFGDLLVDLVDGEVALDEGDALGLARGDFAVLFPDALVEGFLLLLEAVFILAGLGGDAVIAASGAVQADGERGQQEQGEIGLQVAADQAVHVEDELRAELAAATLVGLGRVRKSIAENDFASGEGGLNHLSDGLGAIGEHQGQLGHGREGGGAGIEQQSADAVARGGAAGLAGNDGVQAAPLDPCGQALDLRGFTGPVKTFERDEKTARHGVSLSPAEWGRRLCDKCVTRVHSPSESGVDPAAGTGSAEPP